MNSSTLADGLKTICARVLVKNAPLACLHCVNAVPYDGGTAWTVTNLDTWATVRIDGPEIGPALIPVTWLRSLLVGQEVEITSDKKNKLTVKSGGLTATTPVITDDFPETPDIGKIEHEWETNADRWRRLHPCLCDMEARFVMMQFLCVQGDAYATDGRLPVRSNGPPGDFEGLIPGAFPWGLKGDVQIKVSQSYVAVSAGAFHIVAKRPAGFAPHIRAAAWLLYESSLAFHTGIDRLAFTESITPLMKFNSSILDCENGVISARNAEGGTIESALPFRAEFGKIGLGPAYLYDVLFALGSDTVSLFIQDEKSPIVIRGEGADGIIMPMRIQG